MNYRLIAFLATLLALTSPACKKRRKTELVKASAETAGRATMVQVADPKAEIQLLKGFHAIEGDAWRWAMHEFSVNLHPPKDAAANGARLVLKFSVPDPVIQRTGPMTVSARVNGSALPPQEYTKAGDATYVRDVPPGVLAGDTATVDFTVDKFLPPSPGDGRELSIIVSAVGFEAKAK